MSKILLILSSPRGKASLATRFAFALTEGFRSCGVGTSLIIRDLADPPLPRVDTAYINGRSPDADERSCGEIKSVELAAILIGEVQEANIVIIASSLVNCSLSSALKTWFDYLIWPRVAIKYTNCDVENFITEKKVFVVTAAGGIYLDGGVSDQDFQMTYLRHGLKSIGLQDITEIRAEEIWPGAVAAQAAMHKASVVISNLVGTIAQRL